MEGEEGLVGGERGGGKKRRRGKRGEGDGGEIEPGPVSFPCLRHDGNIGDSFRGPDLLLTTGLRDSCRRSRVSLRSSVPPGPHQLRVGLYRANQILANPKRRLGGASPDSDNTRLFASPSAPIC